MSIPQGILFKEEKTEKMENNKDFKIMALAVVFVLILTLGLMVSVAGPFKVADGDKADTDQSVNNIPADGIYTVDLQLLGATTSNSSYTMKSEDTLTVSVIADDKYFLPDSISIDGASHTWTRAADAKTATLVITNPKKANIAVEIDAFDKIPIEIRTVLNNPSNIAGCAFDVVPYNQDNLYFTSTDRLLEFYTACVGCTEGDITVSGLSSDGYDLMPAPLGSEETSGYQFTWGGAYPTGGTIIITVQFNAVAEVALSLSNCTVTNATVS